MSEPTQLGKVLPEVLAGIKNRCDRYRKKNGLPTIDEELQDGHSGRVFSAVMDFMKGK